MKIGLSGHQNIPPETFMYVKTGIMDVISKVNDDLVGISALASGADQLFASLILERKGHLHIIIPCQGYETTFPDRNDLEHFRLLLSKADTVETLNYAKPSEEAYLHAGYRVVDSCDFLIAIWDGIPARGKGGTGDVVEYARNRGIRVEVIWPSGVSR
jgi:hypothetical protein